MPAKTTTLGRVALRWPLLALLLVVGLAVAACGGGDSDKGGAIAGLSDGEGSVPEGADLLPADVPVLITLNTDLDSEQWQQAGAIAERFPGSQDVIDEALRGLAGEGLDFDEDIRPALGTEASIAVLELTTDGEDAPVAAVLKPSEGAELESLLERNAADDPDDAPVWRVVDEWYMLADDEATLDAVLAGADASPLSDDDRFKNVMESLPGDSLARIWVSPAVVDDALAQAAAENPDTFEAVQSMLGVGEGTFEGTGLALRAVEEGIALVGISKTSGAPVPGSGPADILDLAPGGALAYVSLRDLRDSIDQIIDLALEHQPEAEMQLGQVEALLGLTIEDDLLPLFENEHAVYVRPGVPIPEVTIVLSPDDPAGAADLIKQLLAFAEIGGVDVESDTTDVGGVEVLRLSLEGTTVLIGSVEGHLVLTTAESGIADFGGADNLRSDPRFAEASEAAGLPDETGGFVYVDVKGVVELVTLGGLLGAVDRDVDPEVLRNLEPLNALVMYGTASEDEQQFAGLLTIE